MAEVIVVGGGQAAASLVARLRSRGFAGGITLIGDEPLPPYQRPPLSKAYLLGEMTRERLFLRPQSYYADQSITLRTGLRVESIDPEARRIEAGGEPLSYDHLVLATGARPRHLPEATGGALKGVYAVRDLADVDAMAPEFRAGRRVLVVGGGYIGLEAAAVAAKQGLEVTLVEAAERILQRVAATETADYFRALHQAKGVTVIENARLGRLTGEDRVTGAVLADGREIETDFAIVGIGIEPRTELAADAGLRIENGIAVDAQGETSAPGIWAAGDCASFPHGAGRLRLESVGNAIDMGELVADNILGAGTRYDPAPWFWSDQYDCKLQIAGLGQGHDRVVIRAGDTGARSHWYFASDTLLALDAMNDPRAYMVGKRLIEAGRSPDPELLADPATDLKTLLRA